MLVGRGEVSSGSVGGYFGYGGCQCRGHGGWWRVVMMGAGGKQKLSLQLNIL